MKDRPARKLTWRSIRALAPVAVLLAARSTALACDQADAALPAVLQALARGDAGAAQSAFAQTPPDQRDCPSALRARGRIAATRGDVTGALAAFGSYVEAVPSDLSGLLDLAQAQLLAGRQSEARLSAREAIESATAPAILTAAGQLLEKAGDVSGAEQAHRKAVRLAPSDPQAIFRLGVFHDSRQQHVKAEQAFRQALTLTPNSPHIYDYLGLSLAPQGKTAEAEQAFKKGLSLNSGANPDPFLPYNYGRLLAQLNRLPEAVDQLDQAAGLAPGTRAILYERAKTLHRMGRHDAAREDAEAALGLNDPGGVVLESQIYYLLVRICSQTGDEAAVERYSALARSSPAPRNARGR